MLRASFFYILSIFGIILENTMVFVDLSSGMLFIFVVTAYGVAMEYPTIIRVVLSP